MPTVPRLLPILLGLALVLPGGGEAQEWHQGVLISLGSAAEDRLRMAQMLGDAGTEAFLLRSASTLTSALVGDPAGPAMLPLPPQVELIWNSDLPFTMNDGALWAGKGFNLVGRAGVWARWGPVRLVLAPEVIYEENRPFQTIVYQFRHERSIYAHPYHPFPESMDMPLRFGPESRTKVAPGQSSVTVDLGPVATGVASENLWWGPGIRNAIVMSDNAAGVPHLFLATRRPIETPLGTLEGRWMLGRLTESEFFDLDPSNDHGSLSALALTLSPAFEPNLTLGLARAVFAPLGEGEWGFGAAFDVFTSVGRPNSKAGEEPEPGPDQIFSLFGRWVFPGAGFEVYGEWARFEEPASFRDFLELPNHSRGYTAGFQWARVLGDEPLIRVQAELTNLEPAATFRVRPPFSSYTSSAVPQGYTNRGQVLGASIGSAASSQWIAVDYLRPRWSLGGFWGRIRADNDAFVESPTNPKREDVTFFWGLRGGREVKGFHLDGRVSTGIRLNYLFQALDLSGTDGVDVPNHTVSVTLSRAVSGAAGGGR